MNPGEPHSRSIEAGRADANLEIVVFHGYTGSTDEFYELADTLASRLDAHVSIPLLPGHGTKETDLLPLRFNDFADFAKQKAQEAARGGKRVIFIGHSFGGYLAFLAAEDVEPVAMIVSVVPYVLRWRFWLPWTSWIMRLRDFWDKEIPAAEHEQRKGLFFYQRMPGIGLMLVNEGIEQTEKILPGVSSPILTIHNTLDPISTAKSGQRMLALSAHNPLNKSVILINKSHGVYYGPHGHETVEEIAKFLEGALRAE